MAAIYSNGGNRWTILGFILLRDAPSSVYKISMVRIALLVPVIPFHPSCVPCALRKPSTR